MANYKEISCASALNNVRGRFPYTWDLNIYRGCEHGCKYCFVQRNGKYDISKVQKGEGVKALMSWIQGKRTSETNWCDWNIPLHWGGA